MKYICSILIVLTVGFSSCRTDQPFVKAGDIEPYLNASRIDETIGQKRKEADFWGQRLAKDSSSFVGKEELARACLQLFQVTGKPEWLDSAFSLLQSASSGLRHQEPELLFALSQSSITRHQFKQAAHYNEAARQLPSDRYTACLLDFDIALELGDLSKAKRSLDRIREKDGFDYLIRLSKWKDLEGDLETAIALMEKAREKVQYRPALLQWVESNLADMYGHAGRIEASYPLYRKVLKADPSDLHCLEGLAWIAFSHDRDYPLAKKIYRYIRSVRFSPELELKLAEIALAEGDAESAAQYRANFLRLLEQVETGEMYNKYLIGVLLTQPATRDSAVALASKECRNRFTPVTADLYAWSLFTRGDTAAAYAFSKAYVYQRTAEPEVLLHTATIFAAAGNKKAAMAMLADCRESAFELGPVQAGEAERLYQSIQAH